MIRHKKISCFLFMISLVSISYSQTNDVADTQKLLLKLKKSETIPQKIEVSLQLGSIYLYKAGTLKKDMDSANYYFESANKYSESINDSEYINQSIYYLAETRFEQQNFEESYLLYHKAINYYKNSNQLEKEAETWLKIADRTKTEINIKNFMYDENISNYNNALEIYKKLKLKTKEIFVLKEIADYHLIQGQLDESEKELLNVIKEYKKYNLPNIHHVYNLLCVVSRFKGDFNKSLYYGLIGVDLMIKSKDTIYAPHFYGNVADMYRELSDPEKSIIWYKKSLSNWENNKYLIDGFLYRQMNYLCKQLILIDKEEEAFHLISDISQKKPPYNSYQKAWLAGAKAAYFRKTLRFDIAEIEYLNMLEWMSDIPNTNFLIPISEANFEVAEFYLKRNMHIKAKKYILQSLNVPVGILAQTRLKEANLMLFKIDSTQGNYIQAISHYQKYKSINDSLFNETKSRQIEEIQIQYETEKKENEIKQLTNEGLLQSNKLRKTTITKNYIFGGLILFVIVSILLYKSYSHKQKSNRKLTSQKGEIAQQNASLQKLLNEKEWLLKEVHHRVKNNLQIVMSLLNTQSDYINSEEALIAIRNSQNRLYAISLIHQKLYKNENITQILMSSYIEDLIAYLVDSFDLLDSVEFIFNMDDTLLDEQQSVPVGLILNEAITNAIKYAFPHKGEGIIEIGLKTIENTCFILIKDSGVGLPKDFDFRNTTSLGMSLIKGLSEQLGGTCVIKNCDGVAIEINFTTEIKNL
ncbi:tetratricopeptide repeat-containing sensor histidine kinase [Cellulophaga baltica]|uniref:tetratricopeptide repeat-containing sensor histidine kinase n=1 Tax=Cellulophaga baltica TaxID=76594 RepID=UPI0015F4D81E|nr:sensor histidine kinase [Cellulophaga baltica]MBA6314674.1 sensor histidine kinase [Cellulophaga baltica]